MILSGRDIQLYLETGKLRIYPISPDQYRQNGVDLILQSVKAMYESPDYEKYKNNPREGYPCFHRGSFVLGETRETLELPDDLMAFVELRSTWARQGLFIPPTIVDAGFKGNLTLEIASFSSINVPYDQRFAHLVFARCSGPCVPYSGKYQNQSGITFAKDDK